MSTDGAHEQLRIPFGNALSPVTNRFPRDTAAIASDAVRTFNFSGTQTAAPGSIRAALCCRQHKESEHLHTCVSSVPCWARRLQCAQRILCTLLQIKSLLGAVAPTAWGDFCITHILHCSSHISCSRPFRAPSIPHSCTFAGGIYAARPRIRD